MDTIQLRNACVEAGVQKVVFASSGRTVYGPPEAVPIAEDRSMNPISSYGIVKLAIEKYTTPAPPLDPSEKSKVLEERER